MSSEITGLEQKRVQEVKGSYYIYLPKDWCKRNDIAASKTIFMKQLDDESIIIRTDREIEHAMDNSTLTINLDLSDKPNEKISNETYENYLFNQYLTAYVIGVRRIIFKKRTSISLQLRSRIRKMTQNFLGMGINTEKETSIIIEDSTTRVDLRLMIHQILSKVGISLSNLIEIIQQNATSEVAELINQDDQIDGHRYAIERHVHRILHYPTIALIDRTNSIECLHSAETGKLVERMGDYLIQIAKLFKLHPLKENQFVLTKLQQITGIYATIQENFDQDDALKFFEITEAVAKEKVELRNLLETDHSYKSYIIPLKRIIAICGDISEVRINNILSHQIDLIAHKDQEV